MVTLGHLFAILNYTVLHEWGLGSGKMITVITMELKGVLMLHQGRKSYHVFENPLSLYRLERFIANVNV